MAKLYDVIRDYMAEVIAIYDTGVTTESSYRGALEKLFNAVADDVRAINEPSLTSVGRPDFVFKRQLGANHLTVGHCEAKDIDKDVSKRGLKGYSKDQYARYTQGLPNLIYTNQLEFHFYREGELIDEIRLADLTMGIQPIPKNYARFAERLQEFTRQRLQTITSPERLAKLMAGKALLVKESLFRTLEQDAELRGELAGQYTAFKDQLIHDLTPEGFADIYAETVAYGLFAARLHDNTPEDFPAKKRYNSCQSQTRSCANSLSSSRAKTLMIASNGISTNCLKFFRQPICKTCSRRRGMPLTAPTPLSISTKPSSRNITQRSAKHAVSGTRPNPWSISLSARWMMS